MLARVPGALLVLATPLGNLDDLSPRAREALRSADLIACEDTRRTATLLDRFGIDRPCVSCHKFNESQRRERLLGPLREGKTVVLVSDGGTPGVSDPGALVVRAAHEEQIPVRPLPGPSAVTTLLSVSGLDADRFLFDGFLPHRAGERRRRLRSLREEPRTLVVYESPRRLRSSLRDIAEVLGERRVVVGRELTKIHETLLVGRAEDLLERLGESVRGEVTLAIEGADAAPSPEADADARQIASLWKATLAEQGGDRRAALREASRALGLKRSELQRRLAELDL